MRLFLSVLLILASAVDATAQSWPEPAIEAKAGTRWWWPGSAVDEDNLKWMLGEYARKGIGTVEITPIYGVQGNEKNEIDFLSPEWMRMLRLTEEEGRRNGIQTDMNTGTGWPFGGPEVPLSEAACKVIFKDTTVVGRKFSLPLSVEEKEKPYATLKRVMAFLGGKAFDITSCHSDGLLRWKAPCKGSWRIIALYESRTRQKVKRAAPGGEGWVIDHFDRQAVKHYLERFDRAFEESGTPYPNTFFNDSYEVYRADWTPSLLDEFRKRRGYPLETRLDALVDRQPDVLSDYRETLGELLLENFTEQWTAWAHSHGARTRNQAHGSPANLIDVYAAVDIPEIEGFGLSDFGIKGLRTDSGFTRRNFCDVSMLKYASSAAHITGKPLVSSETFTWLTEHFRTSLSQMKPDLDLMYTCGVNRVLFHGTCYSPKDDPWPGWRFYASVDMSPNNSIWRDADGLMSYIQRCQSMLQSSLPDNDFLVYLPVRDLWRKNTGKGELLMMFDINSMDRKAPEFIRTVTAIGSLGYDCDYISDRYLLSTEFRDGMLQTEGGTRYKALIIPDRHNRLTERVRAHVDSLQSEGACIIYGTDDSNLSQAARPETMRRKGLRAIRKRTDDGYLYFIANLTPRDFREMIPLTVPFQDAAVFQPMDGSIRRAVTADDSVLVDLPSGASMILRTCSHTLPSSLKTMPVRKKRPTEKVITGPWILSFIESVPATDKRYSLPALHTWETLDDTLAVLTGTGVYETTFTLSQEESEKQWQLHLGDVRESARVYINGQPAGTAWAVPFTVDCGRLLKKGKNTLRVEVTNLPANRIAEMDRQGVKWRKFKEINVVDIHYKKSSYAGWAPVESGLSGPVRLVEQ